jgi:hypothetical protein
MARGAYILPTVFGLGAAGLGGQLLWRASRLAPDAEGRLVMFLKGGGLALLGVAMLVLLLWKSRLFVRR